MTRAFATAQYAKDAAMDNSRILFDRHTGDPCGWTDTGGKAHPLPVDFQRVGAAACEQYRAYVLASADKFLAPADEVTMERVDVRQFYRDQNARDDAADQADEDGRSLWLFFFTAGGVVGAAAYPLIMAVIDAIVRAVK